MAPCSVVNIITGPLGAGKSTALQVLESVELDDFRECKAGGIWGPLWPVDSPSIIIPPHNSDSDDWDSSPASSARRRGRTGGKWRTFSNSSALSRSDIAGSQGVSPACARSHLGAFVRTATAEAQAELLAMALSAPLVEVEFRAEVVSRLECSD